MPLWSNFIVTRGEVDDDDLPLPEHRIFDDNGNLKDARRSQRASTSAKKAEVITPKRRAALLSTIGATITSPLRLVRRVALSRAPSMGTPEQANPEPTPIPQTEGTPRTSVRRSASPAQRASTHTPTRRLSVSPVANSSSQSPVKATTPSPSPSKQKSTTSTPRASTKRQRSTSTPKARSSGRASASPRPSAGASARRTGRKTPSKSRSPSARASSRGSTPARRPSSRPSDSWTVPALKDYAKEQSIDITGLRQKKEILSAVLRKKSN